ncbi:Protease Do-like 1, chloroplastic-like protein [Drosera capensis]
MATVSPSSLPTITSFLSPHRSFSKPHYPFHLFPLPTSQLLKTPSMATIFISSTTTSLHQWKNPLAHQWPLFPHHHYPQSPLSSPHIAASQNPTIPSPSFLSPHRSFSKPHQWPPFSSPPPPPHFINGKTLWPINGHCFPIITTHNHLFPLPTSQLLKTPQSLLPLNKSHLNFPFRPNLLNYQNPKFEGEKWHPVTDFVRSGFLFVICTSLALSFNLLVADVGEASAFVVKSPRKLQNDELATVRLFQENTPSVVYITNLAEKQDVFTLDVLEVPQGSGSGFVWDKEGNIVTNYHVIRGASDLRVTLADQSTYEARVVGFDQDKDVAVLHIDAPEDKLRPIPVGVSADLLVVQKVYAIGNPWASQRDQLCCNGRPIQDVIQTDAAINPGNSGGPLLDSFGSLIGINTAIYSPSGVGFSIPVDTVSGIMEQLVKYGKVTRPILGIKFAPDQSVERLGVSGVLVLDAPPTGPARKAGLLSTKRDGYGRGHHKFCEWEEGYQREDLYRILDNCKVGEQVIVEVLRGDHEEKIPVILEPKPDES